MRFLLQIIGIAMLTSLIAGCSPEVGSNKWCDKMDETAKGEWTTNDVKAYAENCVFRKKDN